jgi:hypothetical protein
MTHTPRRRIALGLLIVGAIALTAWKFPRQHVWVRGTPMNRSPRVSAKVSADQATLSLTFVERRWLVEAFDRPPFNRPPFVFGRSDGDPRLDEPLNLDLDLHVRWPLAVGRYVLDGSARLGAGDTWDFRPGASLAPSIKTIDLRVRGYLRFSRPNRSVDQLLNGVLSVEQVREGSMHGRIELTSAGALEAGVAADFDVNW